MKSDMERQMRERLKKEIQFEIMELIAEGVKREMEEAHKREESLGDRGVWYEAVYYTRGEAHAYEKLYNDLQVTIKHMKTECGEECLVR